MEKRKVNRLSVIRRMKDGNQTLCFCYGPEGAKHYWLEPSGRRVSPAAAWRAVDSGELEPSGDGLFKGDNPYEPDITQTWRLKQYQPSEPMVGVLVDKRV